MLDDPKADITLRTLLGQNKRKNQKEVLEAACLESNIALALSDSDTQKAFEKYA